MTKHDFVAIGDVVTDEFIRLKDAEVHCNIKKDSCELCMRFADKIPYETLETIHAVGNAANAAVAATRLGLKTAFVGNIGDDDLGNRTLETLTMQNVSTEFVRIHSDMKTNHHFVLQYGAERTILVKHEDYNYALPDIGEPTWIYLSSLGENALAFHDEIADYLEAHPSIKLAFQPGTFQIKLGAEKLARIYARTEIFFCNKEEAQRIVDSKSTDAQKLAEKMSELGPKIVVITNGPEGAHAYDSQTGETWFVPMYPDPADPVDRTGAGDAFASTVTAALALGEDLATALTWGPVNSMSVVQHTGAQRGLLTQEKLEEYLKDAPKDYAVTKEE